MTDEEWGGLDDDQLVPPPVPVRDRPIRPFLLAVSWLAMAPIVIYSLVAADQAKSPPPCFGIGFGCTLSPSDAALFVFFIAVPCVIITALVLVVQTSMRASYGVRKWTAILGPLLVLVPTGFFTVA